jgi:cobyrinic acid a,c-diamide synthase
MPGLILAAPSSGSGKTTMTLGLLRALARRGADVRGAKSGPDYIDPRFHEAACGRPCPNLDAWAMTPERVRTLASGEGLLLIEGAMGLFDGAPPDGKGATADLARILGLPVVLVVDASRLAGSVAPLVRGFAGFDPTVKIAGVILNATGSERHEAILARALAPLGLPVLGAIRRDRALSQPSRHLGLVQAGERPDLDAFLDAAADRVEAGIDLDALVKLAAPLPPAQPLAPIPAPASSIAVASDQAFAFAYPHLLADWQRAGATIQTFSPLADEPAPEADFIFLPGGYPELHADRIAGNARFLGSLRRAAARGVSIYGECGGYMVLGQTITDADGARHEMAGLLDLETSFAARRLHLGYRTVNSAAGPFPGVWAAHEFHYATTIRAEGPPLFVAHDSEGADIGPMGLVKGSVSGSFVHLIAPRD